jgi:MoaA/NifB/PqqE/SkfB family radical SAM enzyme
VRFINPRQKVFRHLDRLAGWQAGQTPAPVTVEWDLSNRCSLGCQSCHFAHTHTRGPWAKASRVLPMAFDGTGDLADMIVVGRGLREMAAAGVKGVIWSGGGEPTLHPGWQRAVTVAADAGLEQGMYTLGGHLSPSDALLLASTAAFVVVSLDAVTAEAYGREKGVLPARFTDALNGIVALSGHTAAIGVSYLLHAGNAKDIVDMVRLSRDLGATYTTFRPAVQFSAADPSKPTDDRGWITNALPTLANVSAMADVEVDLDRFVAYRDWNGHGYTSCAGIRLNATVTPDGRVWVCPNRRGLPDSCIGDLRTESFGALWSRHPGRFRVDTNCRVMCRLHPVNETLAAIETPRAHEAFV